MNIMSHYRRVGGASNVDESLFGTSEREKILSGGKSSMSSSSDRKRSKSATKSFTLPPATAIVLSSTELEAIKVRLMLIKNRRLIFAF